MFLRRLGSLDGCDRAVLSNAKCLGEGVDVPAIDAVVFVDPRESVIDIVQSVGRTMRCSPQTGKLRGTIILPVVLPADSDDGDADDVLASSAFATVWKVLRALRSHDDRLDDELRALLGARAQGHSAGDAVPRVSFDLPSITLDHGFANAFTVRAVDVTADGFDRGPSELAAYVDANGNARVPTGYKTPTGFNLGGWCNVRRQDLKTGRLSAERVTALDALGFVWDPAQEDFDRGLAELTTYVEESGNARVPQSYKTPAGFNLGMWCSNRRQDHKAGRLSAEWMAPLAALGFVWDSAQDDFDSGLSELATYVAENGDACVPQSYKTPTGFRLGAWCANHRTRRTRRSAEQVAALDAFGFVWDQLQEDFDRVLTELTAYVEEHGDAPVPQGYKTSTGFRLGAWYSRRRVDIKDGRLSAERVAALDALGFVRDPHQEKFDTGLAELTAYVDELGDARVPQLYKTPTGFNLGAWCSSRRVERRAGRLSAERDAALDALGFVWDPRAAASGVLVVSGA